MDAADRMTIMEAAERSAGDEQGVEEALGTGEYATVMPKPTVLQTRQGLWWTTLVLC